MNDSAGSSRDVCVVCGDGGAAMHYGIIACVGCKGFFRRALKKIDQLECLGDGHCVINKDARTNCRACRLQKCLAAGMRPAHVRPDRELTAAQVKHAVLKRTKSKEDPKEDRLSGDWQKRLSVEQRTMLMSLHNTEAKVSKGDTSTPAADLYPLQINTLREIIENPEKLKGKRTEMRYEAYRMAKNEELYCIAYRRLIAAVDWVEMMSDMMGGMTVDDRISLVKSCFPILMVFKFAARTAEVTTDENVLCLCNFAYVPREIGKAYKDTFHLGNGLVPRALDELVSPYRRAAISEDEIVCLSALIVLNPHAKDLSPAASDRVMETRGKVSDALHAVVRERRGADAANATFGNLLLTLPSVTNVALAMCENFQFAHSISARSIPLLTHMFGCFSLEPLGEGDVDITEALRDVEPSCFASFDAQSDAHPSKRSVAVQTVNLCRARQKRRVRWQDGYEQNSSRDFRLWNAPCVYTLEEMFDNLHNPTPENPITATAHQQPLTSAVNMAYTMSLATTCEAPMPPPNYEYTHSHPSYPHFP